MIPSTLAFALVLISFGNCADNTLGKDIELKVSNISAGTRNLPAFETYIGIGKESAVTSLSFEYNFGKSETIIGDSQKTDWGIECTDTADKYNNSCSVVDDKVQTEYYYSSAYDYKKAQLHIRLLTDEKLDVTEKQHLPVQLVTGGQKWAVKNAGVLGLAPTGDFANYSRNILSDDLTLLFGYSISDATVENDDLVFDNHAVVNPVYTDADKTLSLDFDEKAKFWNATGDISINDTEFIYKNTNVCFTSIANELIIVAENIVSCDAIREKVCDFKVNPKCTKDTSDISKAPAITVTFGGVTLSFKGEDYIYYKKNGDVACRIGDLSSLKPFTVCAENTEIALGRTFFAHYYPALTFRKNGTSALTLLKSYSFVEPSSNKLWIILGIIAAVIIIGIVLFFLLRRRTEDNPEDHYRDL